MKALKTALVVLVTGVVLSFGNQAKAEGVFSVTNVSVEQIKQDIYFNVYLGGQETSTEAFKLVFTTDNPQYSTWKSEKSFENQWIKTGVRFLASHMISKTDFGNYSFNVQAVTTSGITSNIYSFSFNYSKPTWQQAGCDSLWGLNQEALDWWFDAWSANQKVWLQKNYPTVSSYGCPNELAWKWKIVKVKQFFWQYTVCADGWQSGSRGRGACSWHGGVSHERGYYKTVNSKRPQFYWVH
jgi:hypothetical protein